MRWLPVIICAYVLLGVEQGLTAALARPGLYHASPGMLLILAVFVSMSAPASKVAWVWLLLGMLYDLSHPVHTLYEHHMVDAVVIGPGALAFLAGAAVMLRLRSVAHRNSWASIALFTFLAGVVVHLTMVVIYMLRGVDLLILPGETLVKWSWSGELVSRFISLVLTALVAIPVGWLLIRFWEIFGFESSKSGQSRRR